MSLMPGRGEEVGRNGQPRALGDVVDAADDLQPQARPDHRGEQVGQALPRALQAGRDDAGRDHRCLEQSEVIAGEVEDLLQVGQVGSGAQVDADQAQHRLVNGAERNLDRRPGGGVAAAHTQVDRGVDDARPLGAVHAKKEDVAPGAVRQVHADGGALAQDGVGIAGTGSAEQFGAQAQRLVGGVAQAEHPAVATDLADAAPYLIGQGLKGQGAVRRRQGAGQGVARAPRRLLRQEQLHGLVVAAHQQPAMPLERHPPAGRQVGTRRQVVAVDRGEEKEGADALVQVGGLRAEALQVGTLVEQFAQARPAAEALDGDVAHGRVRRGDDRPQSVAHGECLPFHAPRWPRDASNSRSCARTCSRSTPPSARAS